MTAGATASFLSDFAQQTLRNRPLAVSSSLGLSIRSVPTAQGTLAFHLTPAPFRLPCVAPIWPRLQYCGRLPSRSKAAPSQPVSAQGSPGSRETLADPMLKIPSGCPTLQRTGPPFRVTRPPVRLAAERECESRPPPSDPDFQKDAKAHLLVLRCRPLDCCRPLKNRTKRPITARENRSDCPIFARDLTACRLRSALCLLLGETTLARVAAGRA